MGTKRVASAVKGCILFKKRVHVMLTTKNIIPMIIDGFFRESPGVSPCNCFNFSSTRLDESSFSLFFGSIFLVFCKVSCIEILRFESELILISLLLSN